MENYYTVDEAEQRLAVSKSTIYHMLKHHRLNGTKVNGKFMVAKQSVDTLKAQYRNTNPEAKSSREICDELNISIEKFYNIVYGHNIPHFTIVRQNYAYFEPAAFEQIKAYVTQKHKTYHRKGGVIRKHFKPNTDTYYNQDSDYSPFEVCSKFEPPINTTNMNKWLDTNKVEYSVDNNHQVFFTEAQFQALKARYKQYPKEQIYNSQAMADILNIKPSKFRQLCIKHHIKGYKILGDIHSYYTNDQIETFKYILTK